MSSRILLTMVFSREDHRAILQRLLQLLPSTSSNPPANEEENPEHAENAEEAEEDAEEDPEDVGQDPEEDPEDVGQDPEEDPQDAGQDQEEPHRKRRKIHMPTAFDYQCTLSDASGRSLAFSFSHQDTQELVTPQWIEPNPYVRGLLAGISVAMKDRLRDFSQYTATTRLITSTGEVIDDITPRLYTAYLREMRLRRIFRGVLQRWRVHRCTDGPATDPITCEAPVKHVTVYDMVRRKRYGFDAKSLSLHIESNLLHRSGTFATPQRPRNPWINLPFTDAQLISIYSQLQRHGEIRWAFVTYRASQFDWTRWQTMQRTALSTHAIRSCLVDLDTADARDLFEDFLVSMMDRCRIPYNASILAAYRTGMLQWHDHWYLQECKRHAVTYHQLADMDHGTDEVADLCEACRRLFPKQIRFFHDLVRKQYIAQLPQLVP